MAKLLQGGGNPRGSWPDTTGGTVTGAANVGTGSGWFKNLVAGILNFKTIKAGGSGNLTVTPTGADEITVEVPSIGITTGLNVGGPVAGEVGIWRGYLGANILTFKSIAPFFGNPMTFVDMGNYVYLICTAPGAAANVGTGQGNVFRDITIPVNPNRQINFKTIKQGTGINVTDNADDITISASAPPAAIAPVHFMMDQVQSPNTADWKYNALAPAIGDPTNSAFIVRSFPDSVLSAIGLSFRMPIGATNWNVMFQSKAEVAPGAIQTVVFKYAYRVVSTGIAIPAWSADILIANVGITTNVFPVQYSVGLGAIPAASAGELIQLELWRDGAAGADTLTQNWDLIDLYFTFT